MGRNEASLRLLGLALLLGTMLAPAVSKKTGIMLTEMDYKRGAELVPEDTYFHPSKPMIMMPPGFIEMPNGRSLLRQATEVYNARPWPNATIPYFIESSFTRAETAAIARGLCEIEFQSCVKFVNLPAPSRTYPNYVNFHYNTNNDCSSFVGMISGAQNLNLPKYGSGCFGTFGTVIHEMLHAIGFWHEQQRRIRNDYVRVYNKKDYTDPANYGVKTGTHASDIGNYGYDFKSIMHYDEMACVLEVLNPGDADKIRGALMLSETDIARLNLWHACGTRRTRTKPCDNVA